MNALDTLVELSGQMELEHAEERRGFDTPSAHASGYSTTGEPAKPVCFTPKARPEFTEREKRAAFVHPAQLPNGKQVHFARDVTSAAPRSSRRNSLRCL